MFIALKPLSERKASAQEIITRLRPKTAHIAGAQLFITPVQDVRVGGRSSNAEYQYTLQGDDLNELLIYAPKLTKEMMRLPQLRDVSSDQQNQGLKASLVIDRPTAPR